MKALKLILALTFLSHLSPAQKIDIQQLTKQFDKIISSQFKPGEPGANVLVSRKGEVIYKKGFGLANMELNVPMQTDNVFRIGSITKQFTAIAILQLEEKGKLDLQDEITKYIPDYPVHGNKITIEHLLTHTSGIRDYSSMRDTVQRGRLDLTPKQMIDYFKDQPLRFLPGTRWEYSNSGYFLLGYIIEKITGNPYAQYLDESIFKPLGMTNSMYANESKLVKGRAAGYSKPGKSFENTAYLSMTHPYAGGSILSTVEDLFKWQQALLSNKLVKKEKLEKAWSRYQITDEIKANYGYGWRQGFIHESPSLWHGGLVNGFITMAMYLPKEDVFVAVLTNCDCNAPVDLTAKLAALAIGQPYDYNEIKVDSSILQRYVGVYENGKDQQRLITVSEGRLYSQANRGPKTILKPFQKDQFFFEEDLMVTVEFKRSKEGEVQELVTKSRTAIESWRKTNKPIPSGDEIQLDEKILDAYVGKYEINPDLTISITREGQKLFVKAPGQEKLEMFAETETKFFLKVNDAQLEFVKDETGKVISVVVSQGGRRTEAKRK